MPSRAGGQFGRRGEASIPSLSLLMILTGREGSWEEVFLVFNVNQETLWGCRWEGRGKRLGAGEGISIAGGAEIPTANTYVYVFVCVYRRGQFMLPHFSQMGFSYNSAKRSSENLFPIIPLYNVPKEESLGRRDFWVLSFGPKTDPFWVMSSFPFWAQSPPPSAER